MIFYPFNDFDWLCLFLLFRFKKHISVYYILMALADILMPLSVNVYTRNSTVLIKLSALLRNLLEVTLIQNYAGNSSSNVHR